MKTASTTTAPLDFASFKDSLHSVMSSEGFQNLKKHFDELRGRIAPVAATAADKATAVVPPAASSAMTHVTNYVKANPMRSIGLALAAMGILKSLRGGKLTSGSMLSGLGLIGKTLLSSSR